MESFRHWQEVWLGIGQHAMNLTFMQVAFRALIVFVASLVIVRVGDKRFLSGKTAFDAVLGFMLASMLARDINGSAPFWATLGGAFVLIALHRLIGVISARSHSFGNFVKGNANMVIKDGIVLRETLQKHDLSDHDLAEDLRLNGNVESPEQVKLAFFERNGQISVVKKKE
ncbi:MAG TPA: YetF domain-containing protein [Verrucomicrobiae bacterium]|jgi:uncharacterized membrane protein YcaP (DUF421 family)|nr:YetF domain-containing protein [Verrucomicrobiae bacterium]